MNWKWMLLGSTLSQTEICRKSVTRGSISISPTLSLIIVHSRSLGEYEFYCANYLYALLNTLMNDIE